MKKTTMNLFSSFLLVCLLSGICQSTVFARRGQNGSRVTADNKTNEAPNAVKETSKPTAPLKQILPTQEEASSPKAEINKAPHETTLHEQVKEISNNEPATLQEPILPSATKSAPKQRKSFQKSKPLKKSISTIKKEPKEQEEANIYLNFENTELANFINYIAEIKKINIIPNRAVAGNKISLAIRKPLTIQGAWNVFLTIIEMAGFSIVKVGDVHKIINKNEKLVQPLPAYINVAPDELPNTDENIRAITFFENIPVQQVKDMIASMLGTPNSVIDQPSVNGLIITGKSLNIKCALQVARELDQSGLQESVVVLRLKSKNAQEIKELLDTLMEKPKGHPLARLLGKQAEDGSEYFSPSTKIVVNEQSNSLILMGNVNSIKKIEDFITQHLDTDIREVKSPLHIYQLEHADAAKVAEILTQVTSSQELETEAAQKAAQYGTVQSGVKFFKNMNFQVDKEGNRLLVSCSDDQDWALLKKTIADLDKAQPQVAIEGLIVSISIDDKTMLGAQLRNKNHSLLGKNLDFQTANLVPPIPATSPASLLGNLISSFTAGVGSTVLTFGKVATGGVWGALQILKTITNTSVLSQPFLVVANKATGTLSVGETRRIPIQQAISETGEISTNSAVGFESKPVQTLLEITPQINLDGVVKLKINISLSEFLDDQGDTQERTLKTNATIANGQVLVLGGFVRTQVSDSLNQTPLLSRIPFFGWLFKNKTRETTKDYIFIFICPTINKPRTLPGVNLYSKMKLHSATNELDENSEYDKFSDPIGQWMFNPNKENVSHKVVDFANARYQPTTVDVTNDQYYTSGADNLRTDVAAEHMQTLFKEQPNVQDSITPHDTSVSLEKSSITSESSITSSDVTPALEQKQPASQTSKESALENTPALPPPTLTSLSSSIEPLSVSVVEQKNPQTMQDQHLDEQRKKLKNLLQTSPQAENKITQDNIDALYQEKRARLKQMLASRSSEPQGNTP